MDEVNAKVEHKASRARQRRWDALVTGLILAWLGVVVLAEWGWSAGLLGVGVVLLLEQTVQWRWNARFDGFYMGAGAIAAVAGGAGVAGVNLPWVAIALIVAGLWIAGTALTNRTRS